MQLVSWNLNGIRAAQRKEVLPQYLIKKKPDVFCIQETKAHPEQLTKALLEIPGYHANFTACQTKKGYSGVAMYSREKPTKVVYGMGIKKFDEEGRIITGYFKNYVLLNCYFPNGGRGPERVAYKLEFYEAFLNHINKLRKQHNVIFCGDVNTAHAEIDLARPKENAENTGFLPEERAWIDQLIKNDWVDIWREQHPDKKDAYTYWDQKTRARDRNVGWRIDYFFVDKTLTKKVTKSTIHDKELGSDHCPISIEIQNSF